jgi:hypothetical protein
MEVCGQFPPQPGANWTGERMEPRAGLGAVATLAENRTSVVLQSGHSTD